MMTEIPIYSLPKIEAWPLKPNDNYKHYTFLSSDYSFTCPIKNGQLFGFGGFHTKQTDSKKQPDIDFGLWRGRNLLFLDHNFNQNSQIYEILNYISDKFIPSPYYPVLDEINKDNPDEWEISAILSGQNSARSQDQNSVSTLGDSKSVIEMVEKIDIDEKSLDEGIGGGGDISNDNLENEDPVVEVPLKNITVESVKPGLPKTTRKANHTFHAIDYLRAVENNDLAKVMDSLSDRKVDINVADSQGYTAVIIASTLTFNPKLLNFLLDHGANVKQTLKLPKAYSSLRICLSMLYSKVNFEVILDRIIDIGDLILPSLDNGKKKKKKAYYGVSKIASGVLTDITKGRGTKLGTGLECSK